jgi:hypothetical protein
MNFSFDSGSASRAPKIVNTLTKAGKKLPPEAGKKGTQSKNNSFYSVKK